jgi:hypothetical protein
MSSKIHEAAAGAARLAAWALALAGLAIGCARGPGAPRAAAPGADRSPKEAARPAPRPGCFVALPGEDLYGANEDASSFDLAFSTGEVVGGAPIDVATKERQPDFGDGDIHLEAPPDGVKLLLRAPLRAWVLGPTEERCEPVAAAAKATPSAPRAALPSPETRAWARGLKQKVGSPPVKAARVPRPAADELMQLVSGVRAGATLRWVRLLAPGPGEAGPSLLVAAHFDRRAAEPLAVGTAMSDTPFTIGMLLVLLADDGRAYGVHDVFEGRMHSDAPWNFSNPISLDDDEHGETILVAPNVEASGEVVDGVVVALTSWKTLSHVAVWPMAAIPARQFSCFGRVDGRPALLQGVESGGRGEPLVHGFVADAGGHLVRSPSIFAQLMAVARDPSSFGPAHSVSYATMGPSTPLEPPELRLCPGDGRRLDLSAEGDGIYTRYWRLSATRAGVGRTKNVVDLSATNPLPEVH